MCTASVRFLSMRVDNFLVSAEQGRKSAKEEANRRASKQTGGQTGWSSLRLLRAPRLEGRQSAGLFFFNKMWPSSACIRFQFCNLRRAILSFFKNKYVCVSCVTTFLLRVWRWTDPGLSCVQRSLFLKFTTAALPEVPARTVYLLAWITSSTSLTH